jgi:chain length determinant protein tyrosine kinase EpsG
MPMKIHENVLPIEGSGRIIARHDSRIGSILAQDGKLGARDIDQVMELQRAEGWRFGEAALRLGLITTDDVRCAIAKQYDLPHLLPGNESISSELVVAYEPFHPRAEELRALRTQLSIRWSNAGVQNHSLAIVSPGPGEGRSYVAANLAVVFSLLGERTLLIDADLRSPRLHRIFNIPDRVGLSAILSGRADRNMVQAVPEFAKLSVLPAGAPPPNPQELLSRPALGAFLQEMKAEFDVVLVDTSAARPYADSQCVAFRTGSAIVLARKDHTRIGDTRGVIRELSDAGVRVIGTVLNAF